MNQQTGQNVWVVLLLSLINRREEARMMSQRTNQSLVKSLITNSPAQRRTQGNVGQLMS